MKTSRDELKAIVKQCLIEILSEGIGANKFLAPQTQKISGFSEQKTNRGSRQGFNPALDTPIKQQTPSPLKEAIRREAGGNKLMESIFADTAATTMMASGDGSGGAPAHALTQQEQFNGNPEQVFGEESAGRWASLAFADSPVKKSA